MNVVHIITVAKGRH